MVATFPLSGSARSLTFSPFSGAYLVLCWCEFEWSKCFEFPSVNYTAQTEFEQRNVRPLRQSIPLARQCLMYHEAGTTTLPRHCSRAWNQFAPSRVAEDSDQPNWKAFTAGKTKGYFRGHIAAINQFSSPTRPCLCEVKRRASRSGERKNRA